MAPSIPLANPRWTFQTKLVSHVVSRLAPAPVVTRVVTMMVHTAHTIVVTSMASSMVSRTDLNHSTVNQLLLRIALMICLMVLEMAPQQFLARQLLCLLLSQSQDFKPTHRPLTLQYPVFVVRRDEHMCLGEELQTLVLPPSSLVEATSVLSSPTSSAYPTSMLYSVYGALSNHASCCHFYQVSYGHGSQVHVSNGPHSCYFSFDSVSSPTMALLVCGETLMMGRRVELWMASSLTRIVEDHSTGKT